MKYLKAQPYRVSCPTCIAAALALMTPVAFGQVTVFGLLDAGLVRVSADGVVAQTLIDTDGNTSSRLGFRGTEDLGGGLKANFWIEAAVAPDTGLSGSTSTNNVDSVATGGLTWGRRSTLGLEGAWGEVRLGRDYVPSFGNLTTSMHPFGTNGVGSSGHLFYPVNTGGTTVRTNVRASNSVGYFLPANDLGFYGAAMVALGGASNNGDYKGLRLGWRNGPWNMSLASGKTTYSTGDFTQTNAGVNYQMGPAKLMLLWGENQVGVTKTTVTMIGTQWAITGQTDLLAAYTTLGSDKVASDATHIAMGLVHSLSKRTAVYANWAIIDNKGNGTSFGVGVKPTTPGGDSQGYEVGIRHSF